MINVLKIMCSRSPEAKEEYKRNLTLNLYVRQWESGKREVRNIDLICAYANISGLTLGEVIVPKELEAIYQDIFQKYLETPNADPAEYLAVYERNNR